MSLKEMRIKAGLKQPEAAAIFGLKYRTYQNYENGVTSPSMDTAAQFARFFNCSIGELFDLEEGAKRNVSPLEKQLLLLCSQLNHEGMRRLIDIADDMVESRKYEKKEAENHPVPDVEDLAIA